MKNLFARFRRLSENLTGKRSEAQQRLHDFAKQFGITVHIVRHPNELEAIWQKESP